MQQIEFLFERCLGNCSACQALLAEDANASCTSALINEASIRYEEETLQRIWRAAQSSICQAGFRTRAHTQAIRLICIGDAL